MFMLGAVAAKVSGKLRGYYADEAIFEPLGMR